VASPFVTYLAVTHGRIREASLLLLVFAVLRALPMVVAAKREQLAGLMRLPLVAVVSAAVGFVTGDSRVLLVLPSFSQFGFAGVFLSSLRATPLVEQFARIQKPDLRPEEIRYCRRVTIVWGVVLCATGVTGLALAAWASVGVWAGFTGIGSYVIVGLVFAIEYTVRRILFPQNVSKRG
jgi:uncharacterized membrane protein